MDPASRDRLLREAGARMMAAKRIALASHTRPDGDAIGSVIALADTLRALGKDVFALNEDRVPLKYQFLPGHEMIQPPGPGVLEVDLFIALDTGDRKRIGDRVWAALPADVPVIVLDHHVSNQHYGGLNYVDESSPATGQIVFQLLAAMSWPLSPMARDGVWTAIVTDTGSFQYPSTTPETLQIGARLLEEGLDLQRMTDRIFQTFPFRRLQLLRELLETLQRNDRGDIAWWKLPLATLERLGIQPDDTEGLIDYLRAIEGVVVAVSFEEAADGGTRVSVRSKDAGVADVSRICDQFGGGGHRLAAGARLPLALDEAAEVVLAAINTEIQNGND